MVATVEAKARGISVTLDNNSGEFYLLVPDSAGEAELDSMFRVLDRAGFEEADAFGEATEPYDFEDGSRGVKVWLSRKPGC